jgi:hypothetical protein
MNAGPIIARLAGTPKAISALLSDVSAEDSHFKPPSGAWSIVEIVCHLADEDRCDFRSRLRSTLETPEKPWPPNDPEAWARDRKYQERELGEALADFERERAASMVWLRTLRDVDWTRAYIHPKVGPVTAGELMVSWAAHDALHVRQIAKRLFELAARDGAAEGFFTRYAGEWGA